MAPSYTISTKIPGWSTASFEVSVNGKKVLHLKESGKSNLSDLLRRGENTVEVRYRTEDGKISFHQPASLLIESVDGSKEKVKMHIIASVDNPRGKRQITLKS